MQKYDKWIQGINFKTNLHIQINGKIHKRIGSIFVISPYIRLSELLEHDTATYVAETSRIQAAIDLENIPAQKYNGLLVQVQQEIDSLVSWTDFVSHGGIKYGLPTVLRGIHREDDCMGSIITTKEECECNRCDNEHGCGNNKGLTWRTEKSCDRCSYLFHPNREMSHLVCH